MATTTRPSRSLIWPRTTTVMSTLYGAGEEGLLERWPVFVRGRGGAVRDATLCGVVARRLRRL